MSTPSLYAYPEDDIAEQVTFKVDMRLLDSIPSLQETIAMSARDPLSTVLHYDVYVRVVLAYLSGLRMCLHCPRCSTDTFSSNYVSNGCGNCKLVPCQNKVSTWHHLHALNKEQ